MRSGRVFDWIKAAELIRDRRPSVAIAGLREDMEWTSGKIYRDGQIVDGDYVWLSSDWATPTIVLDDEWIDCCLPADECEWGTKTVWPNEARDILAAIKPTNRK
jgi:hypothetical protein